ncbi:unnamed protein product [Effrenium voratum]|uniref:Uncharacterized protein n=1 Tax=Effrenium voratum TaxID=2562239 RepID=A0AA36MQE2_9DINO|nr:unnamed protein product [Effrenium voratum]CAJ1375467.1 unnamed protein product [Effrenium voratum]|mmetsp:Transcript_68023/g.162372  ORF Transcript_68023/g.162372 Transcript_68023/m.162372 type:complete len:264 (+) Transcript_68023:85-876(+)
MQWGELLLDLLINCSDLCISGTFVVLFLQLRKNRSAAGLSLQTLSTIVGARVIHLISHGCGLHYVPNVLPWFIYPTIDVVSSCIGVALLLSFVYYYYPSYEKEKDNFGIHIFERFELIPKNSPLRTSPFAAASFLYVAVAILALLWYAVRKSQRTFLISYFCCYYEALGAMALIPQLWMFHQDKRVSPLLANFVVLTALHRVFTLSFWIAYPRVFVWRYPDNRGIQMASETLNLLILSDFLFYWVRSKIRGDSEIILGDSYMV